MCIFENYGIPQREKAKLLMTSIAVSNFLYCHLIWMFCIKFANKEMNRKNNHALRVLYEGYDPSSEQVFEKDRSITVHQKNLQSLMIEIYKTTNQINLSYIWEFLVEKDITFTVPKHNAGCQ